MRYTYADEVRELDTFYENATNLPLPVMIGVVCSTMKQAGGTKAQLDTYQPDKTTSNR